MKKLAIITILALLYYLLAKIRFESAIIGEIVSPTIFASEGVALAFVINFGKWVWPGIFIGQFILAISNGLSILPSFIISSINSIEAVIGYYLFYKLKLNPKLNKPKDYIFLFLIISLILQPFSSILSNITLFNFNYISSHQFLTAIKNWWIGNTMGQILYTPAILTLLNNKVDIKKYLFFGISAFILTFTIFYILNIKSVLFLLIILLPPLFYITYKNISYALFVIISISYALFITTIQGKGPFIDNLSEYNLFILVLIISCLIVNSIIYTQKQFEKRLKIEIKKALKENKSQQLMLIQQNRLAQIGETINMIAHQWKQPLNTLSILNQMLILNYKTGKLDNEIVEYFSKNSSKQIKMMSQTINDFRDFFKPKDKKESFNIKDVINQTLSILNNTLSDIQVKLQIEDITCKGYPNSLGHVILNILNNAKDALTEKEIKNKEITIKSYPNKDKIFIEIEDNAGGIKKEYLSKIFEPYFSTKSKNGTGLGLYMSKIIIQEHMKGTIKAVNTKKGAKFIIEIEC